MLKRFLPLTAAILFSISSARADEGMWMLNTLKQLNEADMQKAGFKLTADDIYNINHASMKDAIVHFGGFCTGEIVSSEGLILTNHHCGLDAVQGLSSVENDMITNGYWATSRDKELSVPGLWVKFLVRIEDVTSRVKVELSDTLTEAQLQLALPAIYKKITGEATDKTTYTADVRAAFQGNEYYLFVYETYKDVRLVGAPPFAIGNFGGDTDNWMWPRQTGDFSMFRVYTSADGKAADYSKDNIPMKSKYYIPVSANGIREGDFMMTLGYPGRTDRYATSFSVEMAMELTSPAIVKIREKRLNIWDEAMESSDDIRIKYQAKHNQISNYWKYFIGQIKQLKRNRVPDKKRELETQFQQWVNADASRKAEYGSVLENLKLSYTNYRKFALVRQYLQECALAPEILSYAYSFQDLSKLLNNKEAKPEEIKAAADKLKEAIEDRFKEYDAPTDQKILAAMLQLYHADIAADQQAPIFAEIEKKYKNNFGDFAEEVFENSIFVSKEKVTEFLANPSAKKLNKDLALRTIMSIYDHYINNYRATVRTYDQTIAANNRKFIRGLRLMMPDKKFSPDANGTMRLSYGNVKSYNGADAVSYNWYTTMDGIMEKMDNTFADYKVPAKQAELYNKKDFGAYGQDGKLHTCFLTTNDITGGNSGSPVINGSGQLVGIAFDGNWEAMSGDISYDPLLKRTICVDIRYVLWTIEKLMGGKNTIDELKVVTDPLSVK